MSFQFINLQDPKEPFTFEQIQNWKKLGAVKMTIQEFKEGAKLGKFHKDNGLGYYASEDKVSLVKINFDDLFLPGPVPNEKGQYQAPITIRSRMADGGTHVVWFSIEG